MVKDYEKIIDYIMLLKLTNAQKLALIDLIRHYNGKEVDWGALKKLCGRMKSEVRKIFNSIIPEFINKGWIIKDSIEGQNVISEGQYVPDERNNMSSVRDNLSLKEDNMSSMRGTICPREKSSNINMLAKNEGQCVLDKGQYVLDEGQYVLAQNKVKSTVCKKSEDNMSSGQYVLPKIVRVFNNLDIFNKINLYQDKNLKNNNNLVDYSNVILVIKSLFRNINNNINNRDTAKLSKVQIDPPNKKKKRKSEPGRPTYTEDFARFWENYPRKEAKKLAIKAFEKAKLTTDVNTLIEGAKKYAEFVKANKIEKRYILLAHNWLKQERWNDEYETKTSFLDNLGKGKFYNKGW